MNGCSKGEDVWGLYDVSGEGMPVVATEEIVWAYGEERLGLTVCDCEPDSSKAKGELSLESAVDSEKGDELSSLDSVSVCI